MRVLLLFLFAVACGGSADNQPPLRAARPGADGCETNLDAGTPCDPCPGAIQQYQVDRGPGDTIRWCVCANGSYMNWPSCPPSVTCAGMLAFWNNLCDR